MQGFELDLTSDQYIFKPNDSNYCMFFFWIWCPATEMSARINYSEKEVFDKKSMSYEA